MAARIGIKPKDSRSDSPAAFPTNEQVKAARARSGLTQRQAATVVHTHWRVWQMWEAGDRRMHPAMFELFLLKQFGRATEMAS